MTSIQTMGTAISSFISDRFRNIFQVSPTIKRKQKQKQTKQNKNNNNNKTREKFKDDLSVSLNRRGYNFLIFIRQPLIERAPLPFVI
jgi:hypothetical protein